MNVTQMTSGYIYINIRRGERLLVKRGETSQTTGSSWGSGEAPSSSGGQDSWTRPGPGALASHIPVPSWRTSHPDGSRAPTVMLIIVLYVLMSELRNLFFFELSTKFCDMRFLAGFETYSFSFSFSVAVRQKNMFRFELKN